jgi:inositol 3-alpha-galactosyltransferase
MVYLDADIQVFDNIDELFDLPMGAVMDCFCEQTWSHTPQYKIGYCHQCPDRVAWPAAEMGPPPALYFNAGMFVHEPSMATAKALLDTLRVSPTTPFAEQDFLNMFFREQYKPIPLVYNLVLAMLWRHPENVQLEKVKVVHYCAAGSKPWRFTGKEANMDREDIKMLVKKWWDIYNDESLDFKGFPVLPADADELEAAAKKPLRAALAEARTVKYVTAPSAA